MKCPVCGSGLVSARCKLWVDFSPGGEREIKEEDLEFLDPEPGSEACCRACGAEWTL